MSSRRSGLASRVARALTLLWLAAGCGGEVPHGGVPATPESPEAGDGGAGSTATAHRWDGAELIPADLDVVVRIDVARVRASLGAAPMEDIADRALGSAPGESALRAALASAETVWVGLRAADVLEGDRVLVVESPRASVELLPSAWREREPPAPAVQSYDALDFVPRDATARVLRIADRTMAFITPVEVDSVDRVLKRGPDPMRGEPVARGLVSLDWRVRRPGVRLENRYPSFAALLAGLQRVTAVVEPRGRELALDARLLCHNERAADRAARFLKTIQQGAAQTARFADLLAGLEVEAASSLVRVKWTLPPELLLALLHGSASPAPAPATPNEP